jgi:hypothetical protein
MGPGGDAASFLLAHTGDLKPSDQQVTRSPLSRPIGRSPPIDDADDGFAHVARRSAVTAARGRFRARPRAARDG